MKWMATLCVDAHERVAHHSRSLSLLWYFEHALLQRREESEKGENMGLVGETEETPPVRSVRCSFPCPLSFPIQPSNKKTPYHVAEDYIAISCVT